MTIKYEYKCEVCLHSYIEQRANSETQFVVKCNSCGAGDYKEINKSFAYAIIDKNGVVTGEVFAKLQNEAENISGGSCIKADSFNIGDTYDSKWNVFVPVGLVYEPISKQFMTPQEKAEL